MNVLFLQAFLSCFCERQGLQEGVEESRPGLRRM